MDKLPYATPPRWWPPQPRPVVTRLLWPVRLFRQRRVERLVHVSVRGLEHVRDAVDRNRGVLITPKHAGHADAFVLLDAADRLGRQFYYMVGWQVFHLLGPLNSWVLRCHGCFSVDREGNDLRAFRQAVDVLRHRPNPLVIFAEGEVYHNNDWVVPFRPGAAAIALAAAQRADRPIVGIPAGIVYRYAEDPMPALLRLADAVERKLRLDPRPGGPLAERLFRAADTLVSRYEREHLGRAESGPFPGRIEVLTDAMLRRLEDRHGVPARGADVPGRVTQLRQHLIREAEQLPPNDPHREQGRHDFHDLDVVLQLFSYTHDYDGDRPSLEHLGEILDKFEEDVLGAPMARFHARRRATLLFGEPIPVDPRSSRNEGARQLTAALENGVRDLLARLRGRVEAQVNAEEHR